MKLLTSMPAGSGQPISCSAAFSRYVATLGRETPVSRLITLRTDAQYLFDVSHWHPPIGHVAPLGGWFPVTT